MMNTDSTSECKLPIPSFRGTHLAEVARLKSIFLFDVFAIQREKEKKKKRKTKVLESFASQ